MTPREKLEGATAAIATAVAVLRSERQTIDAFLKECRDMDNFGSIVDPTLFNNSERRATSTLLEPLFQAAHDFVALHDTQTARATQALREVSA